MIKFSTLRLAKEKRIFLSGQEPPDFLQISDTEHMYLKYPLYYKLQANIIQSGVLVTGEVSLVISCICGRCLSEFEMNISNNEIYLYFENPLPQEIDVSEEIREEILIAIPQNFICSDQCKGLCHICGTNLNEEKCECINNSTDPPRNDIWEQLNKLNIDNL